MPASSYCLPCQHQAIVHTEPCVGYSCSSRSRSGAECSCSTGPWYGVRPRACPQHVDPQGGARIRVCKADVADAWRQCFMHQQCGTRELHWHRLHYCGGRRRPRAAGMLSIFACLTWYPAVQVLAYYAKQPKQTVMNSSKSPGYAQVDGK